MEIARYLHIFVLVCIVIGAAIAFNAIQAQSARLEAQQETTGSFFVSASAYLMLIAAAFLNQWVAYKFYQPTMQ
jgi:hypothetical protein